MLENKYVNLTDTELSEINGGINPLVIGAALYLAKDAWTHADQIARGFSKGWNATKR